MMVFKEIFDQKLQHEIRTPLTAIFGMARFLNDSPFTALQQHYVKCITESANRLLGAVKLLDSQQGQ
jgi:signal transduction histidine kinase